MILNGLQNGGVERVVYNIATGLNADLFTVYIYILDDTNDFYSKQLIKHGVSIINEYAHIRKERHANQYWLLYSQINKFLKNHLQVVAVHVHETNAAPGALMAAKVNKIPVICMHSHSSYSDYWNPRLFSLKSQIAIPIMNWFNRHIPNYKIGCSYSACKRLFGESKNQYFIPNGIDMEKFNPENWNKKDELRKKYELQDKKTYFIFVGRFSIQKNPLFLLNVFSYLLEKNKEYELLIVGHGEMKEEIYKKVKELQIDSNVKFFPGDSNVPELLKASDYFIGPSIYEGLGIVFVEAQLMGLTTFASDQVPREADLGLCEFVPLTLGARGYAKYIEDYIDSKQEERRKLDRAKVKLYDMKEVIRKYERIYLNEY